MSTNQKVKAQARAFLDKHGRRELRDAGYGVTFGYRKLYENYRGEISRDASREALRILRGAIDEEPARYERIGDTYVFHLPDGRAVEIDCVDVESMIESYVERASGGGEQPLHPVAVGAGLLRRDLAKIFSLLGVTKKHPPFLPETIAEEDEDVLVERQLAMKYRAVQSKFEREDYRRMRDDARKWRGLAQGVLEPVLAYLRSFEEAPRPQMPSGPRITKAAGRMVVYQGSDLHYGMGSKDYSRDIALARWNEGLNEAIDVMQEQSAHMWLLVGGDIVHCDNIHHTTTSGRNTMEMDGQADTLIPEVLDMYVAGIDKVLESLVGDAILCLDAVPGNHDYWTTIALASALEQIYRRDPRVVCCNLTDPHSFMFFGNNAIVAHHGHGSHKNKDLHAVLAAECKKRRVPMVHCYAITGNLHHKMTKEDGLMQIQQSSPAGLDMYHDLKGYRSRASTDILVFDSESGLVDHRHVNFD